MSKQSAAPLWRSYFAAREASLLGHETYQHFALFVPLIKKHNDIHILFQVRSNTVSQPGEVSFPGGKIEKEDPGIAEAAFREMQEEMGISVDHARILGALDYMVTPFQCIIHPFLGEIDSDAPLQINTEEVADIFTVPVQELRHMTPKEHTIYLEVTPEEGFPYHLIPNGENYNWRTGHVTEQFYEYNGYIIWGLTARILSHTLSEIAQAEQTDHV